MNLITNKTKKWISFRKPGGGRAGFKAKQKEALDGTVMSEARLATVGPQV